MSDIIMINEQDYTEILQRAVALLPWSHNVLILSKDLSDSATLYYAGETVAKGWNRDLLLNAIKLKMYEGENPSIGIILCAEKDHLDVELALEGMTKPIGVADYQLIIPKEELQRAITTEIQSFEEEKAKRTSVKGDNMEDEL